MTGRTTSVLVGLLLAGTVGYVAIGIAWKEPDPAPQPKHSLFGYQRMMRYCHHSTKDNPYGIGCENSNFPGATPLYCSSDKEVEMWACSLTNPPQLECSGDDCVTPPLSDYENGPGYRPEDHPAIERDCSILENSKYWSCVEESAP